MANKKNKVKNVKVEGLDELVNEGKNIDIVKVEEIIANNSEEPTKEEEIVVICHFELFFKSHFMTLL